MFKIGGVNHYLKETPLGLFFKHPLQKKEIYPLIRLISNQTWQWKSPIYRLIVPLKTHFQGFPIAMVDIHYDGIKINIPDETRLRQLTGGGVQMINRIKYH